MDIGTVFINSPSFIYTETAGGTLKGELIRVGQDTHLSMLSNFRRNKKGYPNSAVFGLD
jgi:hypothetical protein